jgi:hypothetical protein
MAGLAKVGYEIRKDGIELATAVSRALAGVPGRKRSGRNRSKSL